MFTLPQRVVNKQGRTAGKLFRKISKILKKNRKIFGFDWGALSPRPHGFGLGGQNTPQTPPLNGRLQHLIEAAKRGRLDQMPFFSSPLTTRAPQTTVRPDAWPDVRPNQSALDNLLDPVINQKKSSHRRDRLGPKIDKIGAILAIFRPFKDFDAVR